MKTITNFFRWLFRIKELAPAQSIVTQTAGFGTIELPRPHKPRGKRFRAVQFFERNRKAKFKGRILALNKGN